jgi:hypothetical protein
VVVVMRDWLRRMLPGPLYAGLARARRGALRALRALADRASPPSPETLGERHETDKGNVHHSFDGESYLRRYDAYFRALRRRPIALLELGVKTGSSLRMWRDYFRRGRVYGIDIDPAAARQAARGISVAIGSQADPDFLRTAFPEEPLFDVIIDDASHVNAYTLASFRALFHERLRPGGLYVIEDLECSYLRLQSDLRALETWPGMSHNDPGGDYDNDRRDMDAFFQRLVADMDARRGSVRFVHFSSMLCVLGKTRAAGMERP